MPRVTLIGGPNGSGKSTLVAQFLAEGFAFGEFLNADEIARVTPGDRDAANREAQRIVRERRDRARRAGRSYAWETVMSHRSHLEHFYEAKQAGYETWLLYVATEDSLVNIMRVADRLAQGGHDVPTAKVVERYAKSLARLPYALLISEFSMVFDNSSIDHPYRLLCGVHGDVMTLHDSYERMPRWFQQTLNALVERKAIRL